MRPYLTSFRSVNPIWLLAGFFSVLIAVAAMAGLVAASSKILLVVLFVGAGVGAILLFYPLFLLWVLVVGALVVTGLTELYLPAMRQIRWGVVLGAVALGIVSFLSSSRHRDNSISSSVNSTRNYSLIFALLFFYYMCVSTLINHGPSVDDLLGIKSYFQVWGLLLVFAYAKVDRFVDRFPKFMLWLAALQVPFSFHQYLVLAPLRTTGEYAEKMIVPVDIVVGTFVGMMDGGGANASMACLQIMAITYLFALWRVRKMSPMPVLFLSAFFLTPIALNEAKIAFVLFPLALVVLFRDTFLKFFLRWLLASIALVVILIAIAIIYAMQPASDHAKQYGPKGFGAYWEEMLAYNVVKNRGYADLKLNRTTVYPHWFSEHAFGDLGGMFFGHGAGETVAIDPKLDQGGLRGTCLATVRYHNVVIGLTGLSTILWESGLIGAVLVLGIFISAFLLASELALKATDPLDWAMLRTLQATIAITGICLVQADMFSYEIGYQTLFVLALALLGYYHRKLTKPVEVESRPAPLKPMSAGLMWGRLKKR